ncbi:MAG TPA: Gfo/Idh/MocA family oxidoreductase [Deltaproteobacteria bacterium]|nr:Gfo/Idh/MocA family oxidoreductase [Deltaproteobacteria bacterium]HPJ92886.1 Gfo/Idh/MocA family oxidoreductase [Deltaproteobacteria bacterium]HPR51053.1 Gfo/Idh/MocA family oxidoreductase [Deltaproteobacteria bacterium]
MSTLKVAVIGVGYLGRFHAQKYAAMEDVDLVAVVDIDENRAAEIADEVKSSHYTDAAGFMDSLDAVSIAVPTTAHARVAIPFLENGVSVLLEKPISAEIPEAKAIIDAARKGKALLQIGHLERFNPALLRLADDICQPMFIEGHRISPFKQRGIDVDVITDIMIHDIDIILSLVKSPIASVEAIGVPVLTDSVDIANARIRFESGCIANLTASRVSADVMRKIRIFQSNAYISIDFAKAAVDIYTLEEDKQIKHNHLAMSESDALAAEIRSFIDCVKSNSPVVVDGPAGLQAIEVAHTIKDAMFVHKR